MIVVSAPWLGFSVVLLRLHGFTLKLSGRSRLLLLRGLLRLHEFTLKLSGRSRLLLLRGLYRLHEFTLALGRERVTGQPNPRLLAQRARIHVERPLDNSNW